MKPYNNYDPQNDKRSPYRRELDAAYLSLELEQARLFAEAERLKSQDRPAEGSSYGGSPHAYVELFGRLVRIPPPAPLESAPPTEWPKVEGWPTVPEKLSPLPLKTSEPTLLPHETGTFISAFGKLVRMRPAKEFQEQLDREKGQSKTVYVWLQTAVGWFYAGLITVFRSVPQAEVDALVTARFGDNHADQLLVEAGSFDEACKISEVLIKYGS